MNWLDHSKTLREQGVDVSETLLLRRKFFFSDQNVDARDPVQLNLLYVQVRHKPQSSLRASFVPLPLQPTLLIRTQGPSRPSLASELIEKQFWPCHLDGFYPPTKTASQFRPKIIAFDKMSAAEAAGFFPLLVVHLYIMNSACLVLWPLAVRKRVGNIGADKSLATP